MKLSTDRFNHSEYIYLTVMKEKSESRVTPCTGAYSFIHPCSLSELLAKNPGWFNTHLFEFQL